MTWTLNDRVVLVTGAARGIGAEVARRLTQRGARVALAGLEPHLLESLAAELKTQWFECDVTRQATIDSAVASVVQRMGGIDVVVANAGVANNGTVAVNPADAVARTIEVNLVGVARTVSATLPHVTERRGYFLLISSAAALRPVPGMAAYCASKVGVEYFGDALRLEVRHKGVDVGIAHPSWIDTDMVRDQKKELPTFSRMLDELPYPFGLTTPVDTCADALVEAIARRRRKVFIPGTLALFAKLRSLFWGPFWDALLARNALRLLPQLEEEVRALGRSFGATSTGLALSAPNPATIDKTQPRP